MSDKKSCDHKIEVPDAGQPLVFFIVVTVVFFFISYNGAKVPDEKNFDGSFPITADKDLVSMLIYIALLIVGNYFINLNISKEVCGTPMFFQTFITTLLPWVLIFVVLLFILRIMPSWLAPFSNTIGYLIAKAAGLENLLDQLLIPQAEIENGLPDGTVEQKKNLGLVTQNLELIYKDKSLLINEVTIINFSEFYQQFYQAGLFNQKFIKEEESKKRFPQNEFYNFIILKDKIAEYLWYLLTGLLVTSVSYNYIVSSACTTSVKEMEKTHQAYLKLQEQIDQSKKNTTSYQIT